ncbi:hypothetical protein [Streptomyces sp. NPDC093795]|uniref:hypothetical protein n=1 Tax=Streptomyces sp. NPDC093795 TaxID=3366051 RepID=UPI003808277A
MTYLNYWGVGERMSFDQEWASARSQAVETVSMRLNTVDDGNGGRGGPGTRLHVDAKVLDGRARAAETILENFVHADDAAAKETSQVGGSLKGFKSAAGFKVFQTRWDSQTAYVRGLLSDKVVGALRGAASDFRDEERRRALAMKGMDDGKNGESSESNAKG